MGFLWKDDIRDELADLMLHVQKLQEDYYKLSMDAKQSDYNVLAKRLEVLEISLGELKSVLIRVDPVSKEPRPSPVAKKVFSIGQPMKNN